MVSVGADWCGDGVDGVEMVWRDGVDGANGVGLMLPRCG